MMRIQGEGQRLRLFIDESDEWEGKPLYEAVLRAARDQCLVGVVAMRGATYSADGYEATIDPDSPSRPSHPMVIEIVDLPERIHKFVPTIDRMVAEGLVTLEKVNLLLYRRTPAAEVEIDDELELANEELELDRPPAEEVQSVGTDPARRILELAKSETARARRVYVDSVDLLLAMLHDADGLAGKVLSDLRMDGGVVEECLREQVSREPPTSEYMDAIHRASLAEAKWFKHDHVGTEHLLLALCEVRPSAATDILTRLGAAPRDVCRDVISLMGRESEWQRWMADHPNM